MAQTPTPPVPPLVLTPAVYLQKAYQAFATNDTFEIEEVDLRVQATDIADLFLLWSQLGKTLLLDTVADLALSLLQQRTLVVNQLARVATGGEYVLKADSNGPMWAYASLTNLVRVRVRWLPLGDPLTQLNLFPVLDLVDHRYAAGDVVQHTFPSGQTIPLEVRRALPLAGAGLNNPVPTGLISDPNYTPFAPLAAPTHNQNTDQGTNNDLFEIGMTELVDASGVYYRGLLINKSEGQGKGFLGARVQNAAGQPVFELVQCKSYVRGAASNLFEPLATSTTTPGPVAGASSVVARLRLTYTGPGQVVELPPNTTELLFLHNEAGRGIHDDYLTLDLLATPPTLTIGGGARPGDVCYGRLLIGRPDPDPDPTPVSLWDTEREWDTEAGWLTPPPATT